MFRPRLVLLVAMLFLVAGTIRPVTVRGDFSVGAGVSDQATSDPELDASTDQDVSTPTRPKRKESGFARALAAPFRALAKLFGSGPKRPVEAKRTDSKPPETVQANSEPERKSDNSADVAKRIEPGAPQPAPAAETARIIRPADAPPARDPGMWIPVIDGIPRDPLSQGRALLQHGYANEAISELRIAVTVGPNFVEANNLLGLAYDRVGLHRTAIEAYRRALSIAPHDAVVMANLGNSHYLDTNYAEALKRLKQAAKMSPNTRVIHNNLGVVLAQVGRFGDAFKSFARAEGTYDAHIKIAGILETARREKDAARHLEAALKIQPGTTAVLEQLIAIYERTGRQNKAESARRSLGKPRNEQKTTTGGG